MKKMMLMLITLASFLGCSKATIDTTESFLLPEELKDCKVFFMRKEGYRSSMRVVRCPNSNTSTSSRTGKTQMDITVIEQEASNQAKIKESALNKLTEEEKKVLGLVQ